MRNTLLTRRECAKGLLLAAAPGALAAPTQQAGLGNEAIEFDLIIGNGKVTARRLANRLADETVQLPAHDFALEFDKGAVVTPAALPVKLAQKSPTRIELLYSDSPAEPEVRVDYELPVGKAYLRKRISVRQTGGEPRRLLRVDLDNWKGVKRNWDSMHADRLKFGSHPIYCESLWAGVEFPAAFNEYDSGGFILRSRPGGPRVGSEWLPLHSTVVGVAEPQAVRDAFLRYLEDVRLAPPRLVACYNSWWTLPTVVKQANNLALIRDLKAKLYDRHGVFFDIITTDMGWSNPRSIWQIDRSILPQGFDDIRAIVEPAGGKLGLWMSPSEVYPPVCDYEWAEKNGYVVLWSNRDRTGRKRFALSLADPKYRNEVKTQLKSLIRESVLGHIKYDGFVAQEDNPHHGLLPGKDSVEPLAAYSLELIQASKEQSPKLVTEPTYMNSLANYISPWILKYSDTVWGNSGGDCPRGIGPAPDYRESHTNAREYYIFSSLNEFWLPQNAVHYFDIVHCDHGVGFPNHAAMAFGRGRFFVSTYLNPKFMNEDDWRIYAGLLKWARANREILRNTKVLPSRVELGEPYVYAHWLGSRGILAVRNPSNDTKEFMLDLAKAGAPKQLADAVCYTQYPYRKGIAAGLAGSSTVSLKLAPWELLFLEIMPRAELREAVAIGARWYRDGSQSMSIVPDWDVDRVRVLQPRGGEQPVSVCPRSAGGFLGEVTAESFRKLPEAEWLSAKDKRFPSAAFELECSVEVPQGASNGVVLLLIQFPGREHRPSKCAAELNGRPTTLDESSSAGHIGYNLSASDSYWKDIHPHVCEWTWYICDVGSGSSRIRFTGAAGHEHPRIGVWAWCEHDLAASKIQVSATCAEPAMPHYRQEIERRGICLKPPVQVV
jgi:hypothetical protein